MNVQELVSAFNTVKHRIGHARWRTVYNNLIVPHATYTNTVIEGSKVNYEETKHILDGGRLEIERTIDAQEVRNYKRALVLAADFLGPVSESFVKRLHAIVVKDAYQEEESCGEKPGHYRINYVSVGGQTVPTRPQDLSRIMEGFITTLNTDYHDLGLDSFYGACMHHIQFEAIHPFSNGNGRVGRLIFTAEVRKIGLPPLVLSLDNIVKYYRSFRPYPNGNTDMLFAYFILCYEQLLHKVENSEEYMEE